MYKQFLLSIATFCVLGGCATNKPVTVASRPTSVPSPTPTARAKPLPDVTAVEFSPDRKWLAVGTRETRPDSSITGALSVRDCASNRIVKCWPVGAGVIDLAFSPDGKNLAVTDTNVKLTLWHWPDKRIIHTEKLDTDDDYTGRAPVAYSPDGRRIAVGVSRVQLFDSKTWKSRKLMSEAEVGIVGQLRFSPTGRFLLTADDFETAGGYTLFDLTRGKRRDAPGYESTCAPVFSRDGSLFVAGAIHTKDEAGDSGYVALTFETRTLKLKRVVRVEGFAPTEFSPDDALVLGLRGPGFIEIWDAKTGRIVRHLDTVASAVVWLDATTLLAGNRNGVRRLKVK